MLDVARFAGDWYPLFASSKKPLNETVTITDFGVEGISVQNCDHLCIQYFVPDEKDSFCFKKCPEMEDKARCLCVPPYTFSLKIIDTDYDNYLIVVTEVENLKGVEHCPDKSAHPVLHVFGRKRNLQMDAKLMEDLKSIAQEKTDFTKEQMNPVQY